MARPQKPINWDVVELFLKSGCKQNKICSHLGLSPDCFHRRVKEKYGMGFTDLADKFRSEGELMIEAQQFQKAMKGYWPALLWLGKVKLGQREPDQVQALAANQPQIDQSHRIMELEHENAELRAHANKSKTE